EPPHPPSEPDTWVALHGHRVRAPMPHLPRAIEQLLDVDAHQRARHEPKVREGGVAAANVRRVREHPAEVALAGELLERSSCVGDGSELLALAFGLLPEVGEMGESLGGLA